MVSDPGQLRGPETLCASSGCFFWLRGVGRSWETEWEENRACLQNLSTSVRFVFLLSTWAQERFDLPPPEGFLGGKWSEVGPLMVPQMLVPGMLFASPVTSAGPCVWEAAPWARRDGDPW